MVAGEPRCRPCALDARDRDLLLLAARVTVKEDEHVE
jgi:hypothetical protein